MDSNLVKAIGTRESREWMFLKMAEAPGVTYRGWDRDRFPKLLFAIWRSRLA